ncbi:MAG: Xaa-Pro dipeptidyl-peptidase [Bacteroidetes bacterium]|nr:Xaa-Pro dipeptidyl-peptidase [Bacteroidota bacterium]MBT3751335.1 Xaa-Pro dipeptidyl-peptidase [Bacteroidota bacterium]MBT4411190.1 Xaa-Pro dipeptidyl-peptidase [Bacteroidota bacterium]MBT5425229.1 Xaa-Pro dipeptidyl-peptidase [Bacteroidota bacterium]MBT7091709.1 Xaa-Pro dipeptidyl-peptidase [Bacteroidota bacterium]
MKTISKTFLILIALAILAPGAIHAQNKKSKVGPIIKDGMTQVVPEFKDPEKWIIHDLFVESEFDSDGDGKLDLIHVDVTRPAETEKGVKLPVIYVTSPYFAGTGTANKEYFWNPRHELNDPPPARKAFPEWSPRNNRPVISKSHVRTWVPLGYVVVHSSSPGTGLSQGCPTVGGDNESLAPKAVIDWLNGRTKGYTELDRKKKVKAYWATGKVGMTGTSYNGTLPLAAATTGVDGLEAIIPIAPNTSYYHYYRTNGLVRHPGGWIGEDIDVLYDFIHSNPYLADSCDCNVRDGEMLSNQDREKGDYSDWWAGRDYLNDLGPLKAAVLMAHGFNDWNVVPEHSWRISEALKEKGVPLQMYYHQGGHGGEPPHEMMNKWFTRYIHGVENGVENDPKAWIVREGAKRDEPTPYADYPNPDASPVTFYLAGGAPRAGSLIPHEMGEQGTETLVDNVHFDASTLAQTEWTTHRLMYLTPTLSQDLHLSGTTSITVKMASSKPAVNLSVWIVSLPWNKSRNSKITDNIITRGWADLQNYKSLRESEELVPGKFYEMTFDLQPDDQIIPAGQQIGLMIFSSDRDFTLWPEPGTELTLDLDGTSITFPVVGGEDKLMKSFKSGH